jgi:RimJ/RimL family protein N-acetyltransferase
VLHGRRVRLRPSEESDAPVLAALRNSAPDAFFSNGLVDEASTRRWLAASNARGDLNWVIERGDRVVGTISAIPGDHGTEVGRLVVDPLLRRQGVMEEALRLVLPFLAEHFPRPVFLEVLPNNLAAIRLYDKLGFSTTRVRMDWNDSAL